MYHAIVELKQLLHQKMHSGSRTKWIWISRLIWWYGRRSLVAEVVLVWRALVLAHSPLDWDDWEVQMLEHSPLILIG